MLSASREKRDRMSKAGDVFENPVTGERGVVRVGTEESSGELLVSDLYVRPGGAVVGEHIHPVIHESFTVVHGRVGFRLDGRESVAGPGKRLHVPPGMVHDWWNAGEEEAHVVVEIRPGARFEEAIRNSFGLAQDGKTNAKGMPNLLQAALFAVLAPIARLLGYKGSYQEYLKREPSEVVEVEPRPTPEQESGSSFSEQPQQ
jgi:quercetin dioxygenase-like cupin family protein